MSGQSTAPPGWRWDEMYACWTTWDSHNRTWTPVPGGAQPVPPFAPSHRGLQQQRHPHRRGDSGIGLPNNQGYGQITEQLARSTLEPDSPPDLVEDDEEYWPDYGQQIPTQAAGPSRAPGNPPNAPNDVTAVGHKSSSTHQIFETLLKPIGFRRVHKRYFVPGVVFQCILSQEAGPNGSVRGTDAVSVTNEYDQRIHSEVRMFVALQDNEDLSVNCLSIQTYGGRGVSKPGLKKHNHAIVFSSDRAPYPMEAEFTRNGQDLMRTPIKINVDKQNWRVYKIGQIATESWNTLLIEHMTVIRDLSWENLFTVHLQSPREDVEEETGEGPVEQQPRRQRRRRLSAGHISFEQ